MNIKTISNDVLTIDNLYWVKYAIDNPNGKIEIRAVSFREKHIAQQYLKALKQKIK